MPFVNEYVPEADKKRIDFSSIPKTPLHDPKVNPISPYKWTIDRDRDVFLMWTWNGRDEGHVDNCFLYWWKGTPLMLQMQKHWVEKTTLVWKKMSLSCPPDLRDQYDEIVAVLKEALAVYEADGDVVRLTVPVAVEFEF